MASDASDAAEAAESVRVVRGAVSSSSSFVAAADAPGIAATALNTSCPLDPGSISSARSARGSGPAMSEGASMSASEVADMRVVASWGRRWCAMCKISSRRRARAEEMVGRSLVVMLLSAACESRGRTEWMVEAC